MHSEERKRADENVGCIIALNMILHCTYTEVNTMYQCSTTITLMNTEYIEYTVVVNMQTNNKTVQSKVNIFQ